MSESIVINAETRAIIVPESETAFGVAGECRMEVKHIHIEGRIVDGHDLADGYVWKVACENAAKRACADLIDAVTADTDSIDFDWEVGAGAMAYKGVLKFAICAKRVDEAGRVLHEWHSEIGRGNVADGLEATAEDIGGIDLAAQIQAFSEQVQQDAATARDSATTVTTLAEQVAENTQIASDSAGSAAASKQAAADSAAEAAASAGQAAASETAAKTSENAAASSEKSADTSRKAAEEAAKLAQQVSQGAVGFYATYAALYAAHPTGKDGNWAIVGTTDTVWVWDSDTEHWFDSGNTTKFADYYDKSQIDAMRTKLVNFTVPSASWETGSFDVSWDDGTSTTYTACASVSSELITEDSRIAVSGRTRPTDAVRMIAALEPVAGAVKFYTDSIPSEDAVFVVEVTNP